MTNNLKSVSLSLQHEASVFDKTFRTDGLLSVTSYETRIFTDIIWIYSSNRWRERGCVSAVCKVLEDLWGCCVYGAVRVVWVLCKR